MAYSWCWVATINDLKPYLEEMPEASKPTCLRNDKGNLEAKYEQIYP